VYVDVNVSVGVLVAVGVLVDVRVFDGVNVLVGVRVSVGVNVGVRVFDGVTVYSRLLTVKELCTTGAEAHSTLLPSTPPGCDAVNVHVPDPTKLTVYLPVTVHTPGVFEIYCTGIPDVAVANPVTPGNVSTGELTKLAE
jgi:hypothetical protein